MDFKDLVRKVLGLPRPGHRATEAVLAMTDKNIERLRKARAQLESESRGDVFGVVHDMQGTRSPNRR